MKAPYGKTLTACWEAAMHALALPESNSQRKNIVGRMLRNAMPRGLKVTAHSVASRTAAKTDREKDHVLPLAVAQREIHAGMTLDEFATLVNRCSVLVQVTREENLRLHRTDYRPGERWQERYRRAGVALEPRVPGVRP